MVVDLAVDIPDVAAPDLPAVVDIAAAELALLVFAAEASVVDNSVAVADMACIAPAHSNSHMQLLRRE